MRKLMLMIPMATAFHAALAAPAFDGKWIVHLEGMNKSSVEVTLADGKGAWEMYASGAAAKGDPCVNRALPVALKSATDAEVTIAVDGNSYLKGCLNETLVLHPAADGTWTGVLSTGQAMTWTRH